MDPGELDKRVSLMSPTTTVGADGQAVETFTQAARVWAKKEDLSGREFQIAGQQLTAEASTVWTIRWLEAITAQWRIQYNGINYAIISPPRDRGRREFLLITTRQIPQNATASNV